MEKKLKHQFNGLIELYICIIGDIIYDFGNNGHFLKKHNR